MPLIINNITYLNTGESCKHTGLCYVTFQSYAKDKLKRYTFVGKGCVYYRQDDLQQFFQPIGEEPLEKRLADVARSILHNTPMEELPTEWQKLKSEVETENKELEN